MRQTSEEFSVEQGKYGPRFIPQSNWKSSFARHILENNIAEIELNYAKGFRGKDISFLDELPNLRSFTIIHWTIENVSAVHSLHSLRHLEISTYCKTPLDFSQFPELETCAIEWRARASSLFECKNLRDLWINRYSGKDASRFSRLTNLERLAIGNSPIRDISALGCLTRLTSLSLLNLRRLESLKGIQSLTGLVELKIVGCYRIRTIKEVSTLAKLRVLDISENKEIESVKPLANLACLEELYFHSSTVIRDGDLSPITRLAKLKDLRFQDRRHYSHTRDNLGRPKQGVTH